jgi:hypothetical protein
MNEFVKRNLVAIVGVSLPLLLIAFVLAFHGIARMTTEKPAYPVLYAAFDDGYGPAFYDFDIDSDGRLEIAFVTPEHSMPVAGRRHGDATLALFDPRSDALTTFAVAAPENPTPGRRIELDVPEALAARTFSAARTAPDGYRFEPQGRRRGGLLRELFGGSGGPRHHRLVRDGVSFRVPGVDGAPGAWREVFVGWAVDGDA